MATLGVISSTGQLVEGSVKIIRGFCKLLRGLRDVPKDIESMRNDAFVLGRMLDDLTEDDILFSDAGSVRKHIGLESALADCGKACGKISTKLEAWSTEGPRKLKTRLKVYCQRGETSKCQAQIARATQMLHMATSIASLQKQAWSSSTSRERIVTQIVQVESLRKRVDELALTRRDQALSQQRDVERSEEYDDNADLQLAARSLQEEQGIYEELHKSCEAAASILEKMALDQQIGNVTTGKGSIANVGVTENTVRLVRLQRIGDVDIGESSRTNIGVFRP